MKFRFKYICYNKDVVNNAKLLKYVQIANIKRIDLDEQMTDEGRALINRNAEILVFRHIQPEPEPINPEILTSEYQEEIIRDFLKNDKKLLSKYEKAKKLQLDRNVKSHVSLKILNEFFKGEKDSFELRVIKSRLLPLRRELYCYGTTTYLIGASSISSYLDHHSKEYGPRGFFTKCIEESKNIGNLEVIIFNDIDSPTHTLVKKGELYFERAWNAAPFRIIPENEHTYKQENDYIIGDNRINTIKSFRTNFGELYSDKLDESIKNRKIRYEMGD